MRGRLAAGVPRRHGLAAPGAALLLLAAAAGAGARALPPLADTGSLLLRAEEDRELCRELAAGQTLSYRFESNQALVFTAHYHRGDEARALWRKDELRHDEGELRAAQAARYCLTWFNYQEDSLTLRWEVHLRP